MLNCPLGPDRFGFNKRVQWYEEKLSIPHLWSPKVDGGNQRVSPGIVLNETARLIAWRIGYWLCFVLTWAILPILQSFSDSGHRSTRARLIQSLHENARYQAIILTTGLVFLIYFISTSGLSFRSLYGLVIALAYCYSLALAIYLMGHGVVALPRKFFQDASVTSKLRSLQTKAVGIYDSLIDATAKLLEVQEEVGLLQHRKHTVAQEFKEWIDDLSDITALPESHLSPRERTLLSQGIHSTNTVTPPPPVITEEYLAKLTRRLKSAINKRTRYTSEWGSLLQNANDCQRILDSLPNRSLDPFPRVAATGSRLSSFIPENFTLLTPFTRYLLHVYIIPLFRRLIGATLACASVAVVWSELVSSFAPKLSLLGLTISWGSGGLFQQAITAAWIAYMVISSLLSLSSVRLWNGYVLIPRKTSGGSACFYASYAARLTVPLSYNFLTLLPPDETRWKETIFHKFLGRLVNLTPLGEWFSMFFPIFILVPVSAAMFGWYERVKECCGFGDYFNWGDEEEAGDEGASGKSWAWREGRELIERELGQGMGTSTAFSSGQRLAGGSAARRVRLESGLTGTDDDDEGFLGGMMHQVRNTIDTVLPGSGPGGGELGVRPRWMNSAGAPRSGGSSGLDSRPSWFRMFTGAGDGRS